MGLEENIIQDRSLHTQGAASSSLPSSSEVSSRSHEPRTEGLQDLKTPSTTNRNSELFLSNVEKFLSKVQTNRVSNFIENAHYQLSVSNYGWFRNMFLSNEFFKGTQCADFDSRSKVVAEVFERVVSLVREARVAEARWYREVLSKAASKREAKAARELKKNTKSDEFQGKNNPPVQPTEGVTDQYSDVESELDPSTPIDTPVVVSAPPSSESQSVSALRSPVVKTYFDAQVLKSSVLIVPLSVRTQNLIASHKHISTIGDLLKSSTDVFKGVSGVGNKTILELRDGLVKLHPPLGILFDPIAALPISDLALDTIIRLIGEPAPRCFKLLFLDFETLRKAGIADPELRAIYEVFQRNGFTFRE